MPPPRPGPGPHREATFAELATLRLRPLWAFTIGALVNALPVLTTVLSDYRARI